jgi:hypothetical protein
VGESSRGVHAVLGALSAICLAQAQKLVFRADADLVTADDNCCFLDKYRPEALNELVFLYQVGGSRQ